MFILSRPSPPLPPYSLPFPLRQLPDNPAVEWLGEKNWAEICRVCEFPAFEGMVESFTESLASWRAVYEVCVTCVCVRCVCVCVGVGVGVGVGVCPTMS